MTVTRLGCICGGGRSLQSSSQSSSQSAVSGALPPARTDKGNGTAMTVGGRQLGDECLTVTKSDSYGDGWNGAVIMIKSGSVVVPKRELCLG